MYYHDITRWLLEYLKRFLTTNFFTFNIQHLRRLLFSVLRRSLSAFKRSNYNIFHGSKDRRNFEKISLARPGNHDNDQLPPSIRTFKETSYLPQYDNGQPSTDRPSLASRVPQAFRPYIISGMNASKSSQDLGAIAMEERSQRRVSQFSQHLNVPLPDDTSSWSFNLTQNSDPVDAAVVTVPSTASHPSDPALRAATPVIGSQLEHLSDSYPRFFPIAPESFGRYDRNITIPDEHTELILDAMTIDFKTRHNPPGWILHVHPEGAPYFFHPKRRVLTEANLHDETILAQITWDVKAINDFLRAQNIRLPEGADLVLDLLPDPNGGTMTGYYFADHTNRCFFFLDKFDTVNTTGCASVTGVTSITHVRHEVEANYWYHCFLFPTIFELKVEMVDELRDIVLHAMGDVMTSTTSTVPYTAEDLQNILSISNSLRKAAGTRFGGSMCIYSRLMSIFVRQRFLNFYGQPLARLNRDQSVYNTEKRKRSLLIRILSPILFSAPDTHFRNMEAMWVDRLMYHTAWSQFIRKLTDEWQELTLYATVLLNANVAFLAIQSIDRTLDRPRSPIQITSYISTIISIASIVLGLLLVRHYRTKARASPEDAATFLIERHPTMGLEALAIMYSLPYALLMWALVSFLAAFTLMCLLESDLSTRSLVVATWAVMAALIGWSIWMSWESNPKSKDASPSDASESAKNPASDTTHSGHKPPIRRWGWFSMLQRCSRTSEGIFTC